MPVADPPAPPAAEPPSAAPAVEDAAPATADDAPPEVRFPTPTLLQMEAVECGAACLGILLSHYGQHVPLEQLRLDCGVSRDGSKASNLLRAARRYGLQAAGTKQELSALHRLARPLILFWNFNHFVVLEGFHHGRACLNDPATGPRQVPLEELDAAFTGIVLEVQPGPGFQPSGERPSLWPALLRRLTNSRGAFAYVFLCTLFMVVPGLVIPTYSRIFVDEYLVGGHADWVRPLLVAMAVTALASMALSYLREFYLLKFQTKLALTSSSHFLAHVLRLPVEFFSQRYGGEIGSRVLINDKVARILAAKLGPTVLDALLVGFYALLMLQYDVLLTFACVAIALLNVLAIRLVSRQRVDGSRRLLQEKGKLTGTAMGGLQMIETLKATGGEADFFGRWAGYQAKTLQAQQNLGYWTQCLTAVPPLLNTITTTAILALGGLRVMDGHLTMGMLVAFQALMINFTKPINNLVTFGSTVQELEGDMNRLDDVLRYPQDVRFQRSAARRATRQARVTPVSPPPPVTANGAQPVVPPPGPTAESVMLDTAGDLLGNLWKFLATATPTGADDMDGAVFRDLAGEARRGGSEPREEPSAGPSPLRNGHVPTDATGTASRNGHGTNGHRPAGVVVDQKPAVDPIAAHPPIRAPKLSGLVELRGVTFGYNPLDKPLIEDFNLVIKPGQRVALIGGSGSGKSTVARLVAGLFRPRAGEILFDGVPREQVPTRLLTGSVAVVDQEVFFFEGSIKENLAMWDATVPEADLTAAIRDACVADLIGSRPQGINGRVAEGGANFSGGQRQRLEIARALVVRPTFLILDEATSALDPTTESQIDENLRRLGCSCLVVAHRLSTIRDCDEILVMERGRVVQRGTHEGMKDVEGPYAALIGQH